MSGEGVGMNVESVEKIYSRYSSVYDLIFGKIFHSGRQLAVEMSDIRPGDRVLEVGVGTGLSLPCYPPSCKIVGIDISSQMLEEAEKRIREEGIRNTTLRRMDATRMEFPDDSFDKVLAAYVITTVPDPVKVVSEIKRVCKPGGKILFLNHFRSPNRLLGSIERHISPLCYRLGFKTDLDMETFLRETALQVAQVRGVNLFQYWKLVECLNQK